MPSTSGLSQALRSLPQTWARRYVHTSRPIGPHRAGTSTPPTPSDPTVHAQASILGRAIEGRDWVMGEQERGLDRYRIVYTPQHAVHLRKLMIRHTKSMLIGGAAALALPDTSCTTLWLDMSAECAPFRLDPTTVPTTLTRVHN